MIKFSNRNPVTDSLRIIKIGMWVGNEKHCILNNVEVKKVKVTRSRDVEAQKHRIYPVNVLDSGNSTVL